MGHENIPEEALELGVQRGQAVTGKGKHILAVRQGKGLEAGQGGEDKGAQGRGEGARVSQKGLHSRNLWGLKGGRRGSLLRPDAPELQEGKSRRCGTRRMRFPGREASQRHSRVRMEGRGRHTPVGGAGDLPPPSMTLLLATHLALSLPLL